MKDTNRLCEELRGKLALELSALRHVSDDALYEMIDREIAAAERENFLTVREKFSLRSSLFNAFRRLDILQELVDTREITEIMVNGKDHIFVEKNGRVVRWDRSFKSNEQLEDMIQLLLIPTLVFLFLAVKMPVSTVFLRSEYALVFSEILSILC